MKRETRLISGHSPQSTSGKAHIYEKEKYYSTKLKKNNWVHRSFSTRHNNYLYSI